jgi:flagellar motor component MotA
MSGEGNGFTNKEILVRLEAKVDKILDDHERRIRILERFKSAVPSTAIVGLVVSVVAAVAAFTH